MKYLGAKLEDSAGTDAFGAGGGGLTQLIAATSCGTGTSFTVTLPTGKTEFLIRVWGASHNNGSSTEMRFAAGQRTGSTFSGLSLFGPSHSAASATNALLHIVAPDTARASFEGYAGLGGTTSAPNIDSFQGSVTAGFLNVAGGLAAIRFQWLAGSFDAGSYDVWGS